MKKIGIFGASTTGEYAYNLLKDQYEILFFVDNCTEKQGHEICGKTIISAERIKDYGVDYVVVASVYYQEIVKQLKKMDIDNILIFLRRKKEGGYNTFLSPYKPEWFGNIKMKKRQKIVLDQLFEKKHRIQNIKYIREKTSKKKVLIFAYFFPPVGGGGVQRTAKYVKYLRKFGYEPIVVTVDNDHYYWSRNDYTLLKEIPEDVQIIRIKNRIYMWFQATPKDIQDLYDMYAGVIQNEKELEEFWMDRIEKGTEELVRPDSYVFWSMDVLRQITEKVEMQDIDVIYTTGAPFSDFFVGYYLKKVYQIPWIADFRDLWTENAMYLKTVPPVIQGFDQKMQAKLCMEMDKIIASGPNTINKMLKMMPFIQQEKYVVITNGYDEMDFSNIVEAQEQTQFRICFGGTIYSTPETIEGFVVLIKQINQLIMEEKIKQDTIRFAIMGNRYKETQDMIALHDRYHIVEWQEYIEHKECLEYAWNSQVLFLTLPQEMEGIYSGKIFEYIRMKAVIIGIWSSQTGARKIIDETGRGRNFELEEGDAIRDFLEDLYIKWKNGQEVGYEINRDKILKYERCNLTQQLAMEMDKLFV